MSRRVSALLGIERLGVAIERVDASLFDARDSSTLVGSTTFLDDPIVRSEWIAGLVSQDPVEAAQSWIQRHEADGTLRSDVIERAYAVLNVVRSNVRELDLVAASAAHDALDTGAVDVMRVEQVQQLAEQLRMCSVALRGVLHHASGDPDNVCEALDEAMNAAQRDGFTAFTRVLAARSHSS